MQYKNSYVVNTPAVNTYVVNMCGRTSATENSCVQEMVPKLRPVDVEGAKNGAKICAFCLCGKSVCSCYMADMHVVSTYAAATRVTSTYAGCVFGNAVQYIKTCMESQSFDLSSCLELRI